MMTPRRLAAKMRAFSGRLAGDERGSVLIMLVLGLVTLLVTAGASIDFGNLMVARSRAQLASDSVVLYATGTARQMLIDSQGTNTTAILAEVKARAEAMMHVQEAPGSIPITASLTLTRTGQQINAQMNFGVQTKAMFVKLIGLPTLSASGSAISLSSLPLYIDIHVALDVSQSMGLPSTQAGMAALYDATAPSNCVFGCHVIQDAAMSKSNEQIAKDNNILLRVDVLRNATKEMISTARDYQGAQLRYRFGLYRLHEHMLPTLTLTEDLNTAYSAADAIGLGPNDSSGRGDTSFIDILNSVRPKITSNGNGTDRSTAKAYMFIVTDGVADEPSNGPIAGYICLWFHCTGPIDPAQCQTYKDAGITVGVVYTTYLPVKAYPKDPNNPALRGEYTALVQPFENQIAPRLQACASPGWYFEASDGAAIHTAMQKLFDQTTRQPVLIK